MIGRYITVSTSIPVQLKSAMKWQSYKQMKFKGFQKDFTDNLTKKDEKMEL